MQLADQQFSATMHIALDACSGFIKLGRRLTDVITSLPNDMQSLHDCHEQKGISPGARRLPNSVCRRQSFARLPQTHTNHTPNKYYIHAASCTHLFMHNSLALHRFPCLVVPALLTALVCKVSWLTAFVTNRLTRRFSLASALAAASRLFSFRLEGRTTA